MCLRSSFLRFATDSLAFVFALGIVMFCTAPISAAPSMTNKPQTPNVRIAELEIDPAYIEAYKAALKEEIEASIRLEPGVLALNAVVEKENPTRIRILEIYASEAAYLAHLQTPHFLHYKATTQKMILSLKLIETVPILLGAQPKTE